jgi:hypothetical protein
VPEPNASEVKVSIRKLRSPGSDQIQVGGGGILHSEIHQLIMLIYNKEELPHWWKESIFAYSEEEC